MDELDNELILFDRLNVIKDVVNKYGEDSFYISFSGGKDSTVLHYLVDMAIPNNRIPRLYINTGIEYFKIVEFVKQLQANDDRIVIVQPSTNIKNALEQYGYPFKSKQFSHVVEIYKGNKEICDEYLGKVKDNPSLLFDKDFINNLPKGAKYIIKEAYGIRTNKNDELYQYNKCPSKLMYLFSDENNLKISAKCCDILKKHPAKKWAKENNKFNSMTGIMSDEGGQRAISGRCQVLSKGKLRFNPLIKCTKEWEQWFIDKYNIKLCDLYYPPYNFQRTGCKGCPYALTLGEQLDAMTKYGMDNERKQCESIWKPIYQEYRRIGYRLEDYEQISFNLEGD